MTFTTAEKTKILRLKSELTAQFSVKMSAITDNLFQAQVRENCIITGGAIASCFHSEKINDFDLYAKDKISLNALKDYILESMKADIKEMKSYDIEDATNPIPQAKTHMISNNAVTLKGDLQFIYLGTADQCRLKFDFIHCMPWFDIKTQKLYISRDQYEAIATKRLYVNPLGEPAKFRRIDKYTKRSWTIDHALYEQARREI
jgi:hypothetical protein